MLAAVIVSRRFSRKTSLLQNVLKESRMYRSSIGCMVFGAVGPFFISLLGENGVWLQTAFNQLNQLVSLGILIGVVYEIRHSNGTRSINLPILLAIAYSPSRGC
jgi:H+/Cl- antiporter ClcA